MSNKYYIADLMRMNKRKLLAEEFYNNVLEPEEIPCLVTDEASLYDIFAGDEFELINKVKIKYGVNISLEQFKMPFWQLLEYLKEHNNKS
jgi:hypothetical protein